MAVTVRRDAEAFERALSGGSLPAGREDLAELVRLSGAIPRPAAVPSAEFVTELRARLVRQAEHMDWGSADDAAATRTAEPRSGVSRQGVTLVLPSPRRWLHGVVPALLAAVAVVALVVAGLSTRSLPGDRLYPVKLGIGAAQVRLAGSDTGRGRALLGQVDHRIDEVDALVSAGDPRSADVVTALDEATTDLAQAQRLLLSGLDDDGTPDPASLQALADAVTQAQGRLDALGPRLPTGSQASLGRLRELLSSGRTALARQVSACGEPCADLRKALDLATRQGSPSVPGTGNGLPGAVGGLVGGVLPGAGTTAGPGGAAGAGGAAGSVPGSSVTAPQPGSGGAPDGGVTVPGVEASLPGVGVTVPSVGVNVPKPGATSSKPLVTVPPASVTLGPVTITGPSVSLSLPGRSSSSGGAGSGSTSGSASASSSGCVLGLGGICIGG